MSCAETGAVRSTAVVSASADSFIGNRLLCEKTGNTVLTCRFGVWMTQVRRPFPEMSIDGTTCQDGPHDSVAPFAVKLEGIARRDVNVPRQRLAQERTCAEQTRPDRGRRNAQALGHVLGRHLLDLAHHEHRSKGWRQLVYAALDRPAHFGAKRGGFRVLALVVIALLRERNDGSVALATTQRHQGAVNHDAGEPGQQRSEEHTSELQSRLHLVCRLLLEKKKKKKKTRQVEKKKNHNKTTKNK